MNACKIQRQDIISIISSKLTELCVTNGSDTGDCERRAQVDEEWMFNHSAARKNNLYVSYVAEYLAIVEKCILMGWSPLGENHHQ
jgi:hypothetical protein